MWRKSLLDQQVVGNSDQQPLGHQQPHSSCSESLQSSLTLIILECTNLLPCDWLISYLCPQALQNFLPGDRIFITITKKRKRKNTKDACTHLRCVKTIRQVRRFSTSACPKSVSVTQTNKRTRTSRSRQQQKSKCCPNRREDGHGRTPMEICSTTAEIYKV